jgi:hypothetical protein
MRTYFDRSQTVRGTPSGGTAGGVGAVARRKPAVESPHHAVFVAPGACPPSADACRLGTSRRPSLHFPEPLRVDTRRMRGR